MNTKEKTPTSAATLTGAGAETATGQAAISMPYCNTAPAVRQLRVSAVLCRGRENGQTLRDLVHITQWPERAIRKEIEAERRAGALIVSDNRSGYFLTDDPAEAQRFVNSMRHRARQILQTARAIEEAAGLD